MTDKPKDTEENPFDAFFADLEENEKTTPDRAITEAASEHIHDLRILDQSPFPLEETASLIQEARDLNKVILKGLDGSIKSEDTQTHIVSSGNVTHYVLGENHRDPRSIDELESIVERLGDKRKEEVLFVLETIDSTQSEIKQYMTNPSMSTIGYPLSGLVCAHHIAEKLNIDHAELIYSTIATENVKSFARQNPDYTEESLFALLAYIAYSTSVLQFPMEKNNQSFQLEVYKATMRKMSEISGFSPRMLHEQTLLAQEKGEKWINETQNKLREHADAITTTAIQNHLKQHPEKRHIVSVSGAAHLTAVFKGLGIEHEISRIRKVT